MSNNETPRVLQKAKQSKTKDKKTKTEQQNKMPFKKFNTGKSRDPMIRAARAGGAGAAKAAPPFLSHASTKNLQQRATARVFAAM